MPEQPDRDPVNSMWNMSPVADSRATGKAARRSNLRITAGVIAGLVTFVPFGLITAAVWGWFDGASTWSGGGWALSLVGLAFALLVGGFVASES